MRQNWEKLPSLHIVVCNFKHEIHPQPNDLLPYRHGRAKLRTPVYAKFCTSVCFYGENIHSFYGILKKSVTLKDCESLLFHP